jgi:hypothetical protein
MFRPLALAILVTLAAGPISALVQPPDGIVLTQIHLMFEWPAVSGASSYDLEVVVDGGAPDPFAGATPVVDLNVSAAEPASW